MNESEKVRSEREIRSQAKKDLILMVPFRERREARLSFLRSKMKEKKEAWTGETQIQAQWEKDWSTEPGWLKELTTELSSTILDDLKREYSRAKGELDNLINDRKPEISEEMIEAARAAPINLFIDEMKRSGSHGLTLCPFHDDKKPSLTLFEGDEPHYHCFVCQAHGDAIELLMRRDGMKWKEAVKMIVSTIGCV